MSILVHEYDQSEPLWLISNAFFDVLALVLTLTPLLSVSGGRSRLHLISLGDAANAKGGLPLSGVGNVLLAVLSGHKHVPYKSHPLTVILRECLASFSSNISVITHLSYAQVRQLRNIYFYNSQIAVKKSIPIRK